MAWLDDYLAGLRARYPGYVILMSQNNWYTVYDQDADVMNKILNWNVTPLSGHRKAGGPVSGNIKKALRVNGYAFMVIHDTTVIDTYDPSKKKSSTSFIKKSSTSSKGYHSSSRHGGGWVDDAWVPGLPSSRFYRKRKHF